jgi:hypothetical protein
MQRLLGFRDQLDITGYRPLAVDDHLLAFARLDRRGEPALVTIVPRVVERPRGLTVELPPGSWHDVLVDGQPDISRVVDVDSALDAFPAIVLTRR